MSKPAKTLIVIVGPTAIGKTSLAIELAQHFHTEILSADSRQFYKEMSIGTAKPSNVELAAAKHHFINSHTVSTEFSVGEFEAEALEVLSKVYENNELAILAGGSGLYIEAVCQGFDDIPKATPGTRENLNALFAEHGITALQEYLAKTDPLYYSQVDLNNPQRLIRALEVFETTGKPFSSYRVKKINKRPFNIIKLGLNIERNELYQRINSRVDQMMEAGLLEEVRRLLPYRTHNALNTVGYSELFDHLDGLLTLPEAIDRIKQNTRRFAKRQLTWFKRDQEIKWFSPTQIDDIISWINHQKLQYPAPAEQKS